MKYTKLSQKIGRVAYLTFFTLIYVLFLGLYGVLAWVNLSILTTPVFNIMWIALIPAFGIVTIWTLARWCGDEIYDTGLVSDGDTLYEIKRTPKFYKRRMYVYFIEAFLFVLLMVKNIVLFVLDPIWSVVGIVGGVAGVVFCFIIAMSSKELSKQDDKKEESSNNNAV